jgi:hypothetical protein
MDREQKQLRIATAPVPGSDDTELELTWGQRELGSLTLHPDDFAEFIESLRGSFRVVITGIPTRRAAERLRQRDTAEFAAGLPSEPPDEQDD